MKIIILLLVFWVGSVVAAQRIDIPQGRSERQAPVNPTHRSLRFEVESAAWTNENITAVGNLYVSFDGGKTWLWHCGFTAKGGKRPITGITCPKPDGVTNVRSELDVQGGTISIGKDLTLESR